MEAHFVWLLLGPQAFLFIVFCEYGLEQSDASAVDHIQERNANRLKWPTRCWALALEQLEVGIKGTRSTE